MIKIQVSISRKVFEEIMAIEQSAELAEILGVSRQAINNHVLKALPEADTTKNEVTVVTRSEISKLEEYTRRPF